MSLGSGSADDKASAAIVPTSGLKRWARPVMNLAAVVFVALAVRDMASKWEGSRVALAPWPAVVASVPLLLSCLAQGLGWIFLVEAMAHRRVPRGPALALYFKSQLARYTPGKVGLPIVRMEGAPRLDLPRSIVGVSVLVEMLSWTASGAVVGFALLAVAAPKVGLAGVLGKLAVPLFVGSALGALILLLVDRRVYPAKVRAVLAPEGEGPIVPPALPLAQLVYWLLVAVHGYAMSLALGTPAGAAVTAMGFYVIAQVAGFVALAAPAGLGVREAVLVAGLSPAVGAAGALGAAVISRALSFVAELVVWLGARAVWGGSKAPRR
ncbi:MAG TPA: lysylphosphatidylglycerol synthase domain-containing protein [Polyangiaceae bacterium]|jgi:hypothetical protein|nr:lysylphosphatidylglycerol synthase domain-containing protein [Polyangiaceae bacterium]